MKNLFIYITTIVLVLSSLVDSERSGVLVVLKHSTSYGNKKYVDKILTPRKPINRTTSLTSLDVYFRPGVSLDSPIYGYFVAYKKFNTQYRPFMVDLRAEVCDVFKFKNHPLYQILKDNVNGSNVFDPCPIQGHRFILPYYTSYEKLPSLIPTGMWRLDVRFTKEVDGIEEEVLRTSDYYEVTPTGIEEF